MKSLSKKDKKKTSGAGAEGDRRTDGEQRKCLAGNSGWWKMLFMRAAIYHECRCVWLCGLCFVLLLSAGSIFMTWPKFQIGLNKNIWRPTRQLRVSSFQPSLGSQSSSNSNPTDSTAPTTRRVERKMCQALTLNRAQIKSEKVEWNCQLSESVNSTIVRVNSDWDWSGIGA